MRGGALASVARGSQTCLPTTSLFPNLRFGDLPEAIDPKSRGRGRDVLSGEAKVWPSYDRTTSPSVQSLEVESTNDSGIDLLLAEDTF